MVRRFLKNSRNQRVCKSIHPETTRGLWDVVVLFLFFLFFFFNIFFLLEPNINRLNCFIYSVRDLSIDEPTRTCSVVENWAPPSITPVKRRLPWSVTGGITELDLIIRLVKVIHIATWLYWDRRRANIRSHFRI